MATYAFDNTLCAISGPNGAFNIGTGSGNTEGGITITMIEDKNTMTIGADGEVMHSRHSGRGATATIRLLKTSPTNRQLSLMYNLDTAPQSRTHGQNTIALRDLARGDVVTCTDVAFQKQPDLTYAKDGGEMVWTFAVGKCYEELGSGIDSVAA